MTKPNRIEPGGVEPSRDLPPRRAANPRARLGGGSQTLARGSQWSETTVGGGGRGRGESLASRPRKEEARGEEDETRRGGGEIFYFIN